MTARTRTDRTAPRAMAYLVAGALLVLACTVSKAMAASIAAYASDCLTPQTAFVLGDTVCAIAEGMDGLRLQWVNPDGYAVAVVAISSDPATEMFVLPTTDDSATDSAILNNLGRWRVSAVTARSSTRKT